MPQDLLTYKESSSRLSLDSMRRVLDIKAGHFRDIYYLQKILVIVSLTPQTLRYHVCRGQCQLDRCRGWTRNVIPSWDGRNWHSSLYWWPNFAASSVLNTSTSKFQNKAATNLGKNCFAMNCHGQILLCPPQVNRWLFISWNFPVVLFSHRPGLNWSASCPKTALLWWSIKGISRQWFQLEGSIHLPGDQTWGLSGAMVGPKLAAYAWPQEFMRSGIGALRSDHM